MSMAMRRHSISFLSRRRLSTAAALAPPRPSPRAPAKPTDPSRESISLLKSFVVAESDPEKILALFQSSNPSRRIYGNQYLYEIIVGKLSRLQRPDLVERLLESHKSAPSAPTFESFFVSIMSLYSAASMPDHALRTFEQIPSRTEHSVCALLSAYLKQHRYDRVRELFDRIPVQYSVVPGVTTYNILLAALCNAGEVRAARKVLDEMTDKKGLTPNAISYNTLLTAYLKSEDEAGFDEILQEISRNDLALNISTYNLRIWHCYNRKEILKAVELLDELVSNGIEPIGKTFSIIIKGFCEEGDVDSAMKVWRRLKATKNPEGNKKILPTVGTFIVLLRALVRKGDFTSALPICQECLKRDFPPPFEVMRALVPELVKNSKSEQAKLLVNKMRKVCKGFASDSWTKLEAELPL